MRPGQQQQQNKRMRGRGRKGPNPMSRSYESNGPDVKIRGNAQHIAEKYIALARDANASGDRVMAENYLQHAEHYGRIVAAAQGSFQLQRDDVDADGDYEEGDDEGATEGFAPTNGHPYPVPERAQGERPPQQQPNQGRENREFQNRDYQGNRDQNNNRDHQGNREGREQRFDRNRNRDRDFNRDNQGQGRDRNRDNRPDGEGRRSWEGRDRQNWQDRQVPNGLGPQPSLAEAGTNESAPNTYQADEPAPRQEERFVESPRADEIAAAPVVSEQESGFGQGVATQGAVAEPEGSIYGGEAAPEAREPRRRGRPRRPRYGESEGSFSGDVAAPVEAAAPAPEAEAPMPVASAESVSSVDTSADAEAAPAKRRPGRPRKKKVDDDAGDADTGHLPDFLLASNG